MAIPKALIPSRNVSLAEMDPRKSLKARYRGQTVFPRGGIYDRGRRASPRDDTWKYTGCHRSGGTSRGRRRFYGKK